jgi:hypothetical protein
MSVAQAAAAAVAVFPNVTVTTTAGPLPLPVIMVAIAGAESGWNPTALGDYGYGGPTCPTYGGATSFGLWQIHNIHAAYLATLAGSSDPCVWIPWLFDPLHNAVAAYGIYRGPIGLGNWTTYLNGAWRTYLPTATAAVAAVRRTSSPPPSAGLPQGQTATAGWVGWLVVGGAAVGGALLAWDVVRPQRRVGPRPAWRDRVRRAERRVGHTVRRVWGNTVSWAEKG